MQAHVGVEAIYVQTLISNACVLAGTELTGKRGKEDVGGAAETCGAR